MLKKDHPDYPGFPDLDKKYYEALGRVSTAFSELETTIYYSILALAEGDWNKIAIITAPLSIQNRLNAIKALAEIVTVEESEKDKIESLVAKILGLIGDRNRFIHGYHIPIEGNSSEVRFQKINLRSDGLKIQEDKISIKQLEKLSSDFWKANNELTNFIHNQYEKGNITDTSGKLRQGFSNLS